jgi:NadR type nicotinamide-nucleotide adenylyltransferase
VIGKFYPPHLGHHYLIREAARQSSHVTVVVMASSAETIPLASRVAWLREEHRGDANVSIVGVQCEAPVMLTSEPVWRAQIGAMAAAIRQVSMEPVDAVFSSETYGVGIAERFGAVPVIVDKERVTVPISATAVRRDLASQWEMLSPPVRRGLSCRVVVLGSESTGTTTLSRAIADYYRKETGQNDAVGWVREYGRDYTVEKLASLREHARIAGLPEPSMNDLLWIPDDFVQIALTQQKLEDAAATMSPLVIADTDAFATLIWEKRYLGTQATLQVLSQMPRRALYLVTDHTDVDFEQDGIRDGEHVRARMTSWFTDELTRRGEPWVLISGTREERLKVSTEVIDRILAQHTAYGVPLG